MALSSLKCLITLPKFDNINSTKYGLINMLSLKYNVKFNSKNIILLQPILGNNLFKYHQYRFLATNAHDHNKHDDHKLDLKDKHDHNKHDNHESHENHNDDHGHHKHEMTSAPHNEAYPFYYPWTQIPYEGWETITLYFTIVILFILFTKDAVNDTTVKEWAKKELTRRRKMLRDHEEEESKSTTTNP